MRSFFMRVGFCAVVGSMAFAPTASAQTAPNAPAPVAVTPPVTASHLQAAREVLVGSGISRSFESFIPQFIDQAKSNISGTRPELIKDLEEISKTIGTQLDAERAEMIELGAKTYANRMSEAELKDISAFFKTPSGLRYVATQPQVLEELFGEMQAWSQRLGAKIIDIFRVELKKRGREIN
jgi:uncharacterized protein